MIRRRGRLASVRLVGANDIDQLGPTHDQGWIGNKIELQRIPRTERGADRDVGDLHGARGGFQFGVRIWIVRRLFPISSGWVAKACNSE
jgi:hypothetical protein